MNLGETIGVFGLKYVLPQNNFRIEFQVGISAARDREILQRQAQNFLATNSIHFKLVQPHMVLAKQD